MFYRSEVALFLKPLDLAILSLNTEQKDLPGTTELQISSDILTGTPQNAKPLLVLLSAMAEEVVARCPFCQHPHGEAGGAWPRYSEFFKDSGPLL